MRRGLVGLGLLVALAVPLGLVAQKEALRRSGTRLLLPLAPVDPRSLIQGDYMILAYGLDWGDQTSSWPRDGHVVLRRAEDGVGSFVRRDEGGPLAPGELKVRYRIRGYRNVRLGAEEYFFQEGHAGLYDTARFGELRVSDSGTALLVGLADAERRPLGPQALHERLNTP